MFLDSTWRNGIVEKWGVGVPEIDISLVTECPLQGVKQIRARRARIFKNLTVLLQADLFVVLHGTRMDGCAHTLQHVPLRQTGVSRMKFFK